MLWTSIFSFSFVFLLVHLVLPFFFCFCLPFFLQFLPFRLCLLLPPGILCFFFCFCLFASLSTGFLVFLSLPFYPVSLVFSSSPFSDPPLFSSSLLPVRSPPCLFILVLTFFSLPFLCLFSSLRSPSSVFFPLLYLVSPLCSALLSLSLCSLSSPCSVFFLCFYSPKLHVFFSFI